ncbi:MAG: hypothetical protein DYG98_00300 [Haliscomenobacteraceae bacterium CHB4]|nr:hypothetical protein [Haliscomenobacteraceae bacterium CHB4]
MISLKFLSSIFQQREANGTKRVDFQWYFRAGLPCFVFKMNHAFTHKNKLVQADCQTKKRAV